MKELKAVKNHHCSGLGTKFQLCLPTPQQKHKTVENSDWSSGYWLVGAWYSG